MKRILLVLTVALMMAAMLTAMAMPALAKATQGEAGQQTAATNYGESGASIASKGKAQPPGIIPLGCFVAC
jgi:type II secretory pathway pseudopilin PulG